MSGIMMPHAARRSQIPDAAAVEDLAAAVYTENRGKEALMSLWHQEKRREHPRSFLSSLERSLGLSTAHRAPARRTRSAHGRSSVRPSHMIRTKT